jgi:hypothetical protein
MPKLKKLGHGAQVSINAGSFGLLMECNLPKLSRDFVDTTCAEDEFENGLDADPPRAEDVTIVGMWDHTDAGDLAFETSFLNDDISEREATVVIKLRATGSGTAPAASTWTYTTYTMTGRILSIEKGKISSKEKLTLTIVFRPTAKPVKS